MNKIIPILIAISVCVHMIYSQKITFNKNNNIIVTFSNNGARDTYALEALNNGANVTKIDSVFIGCICEYNNKSSKVIELQQLVSKIQIAGNSITNFEEDQEVKLVKTQLLPDWHLDRIDQRTLPFDEKYNYDDSSEFPVHVYIVDTGIRISHTEFEGRAEAAYSTFGSLPPGQDCHGHGTHVAGLVASKTYGVNKNAKVYDVRSLDCVGSGTISGVINSLNWVKVNHQKPAIVNLSLGSGRSTALNEAIKSLTDAGVLVVAAAGNYGDDACLYSPSSAPEALTVGSTSNTDARSYFSNTGSCVDVYAPGENIKSLGIASDTDTDVLSGTSMATPITVGVASLFVETPTMSPYSLKGKLIYRATTEDVNPQIAPFLYSRDEQVNCTIGGGEDKCCEQIREDLDTIKINLQRIGPQDISTPKEVDITPLENKIEILTVSNRAFHIVLTSLSGVTLLATSITIIIASTALILCIKWETGFHN
jgi:subtilisin family serine protease